MGEANDKLHTSKCFDRSIQSQRKDRRGGPFLANPHALRSKFPKMASLYFRWPFFGTSVVPPR
jgi:hypothetical protein